MATVIPFSRLGKSGITPRQAGRPPALSGRRLPPRVWADYPILEEEGKSLRMIEAYVGSMTALTGGSARR
ncbi:hypothetical protein GBF35_00355 [Nonomuraea phyllanthi]|nr:hypothetical protein GBF35_00355 [Nonomuraea phyllanthi]